MLVRLIGGVLAWVLTCACLPAAHAQFTMALAGQFAVNESGAATYAIPIKLPPGTGAVVPALTLQYSSQAANGVAGVGWSLAGLSVITRCPRTMAQDGVIAGVAFDAGDRFCLDGQRLVLAKGSYGADGAEYRTERESFTRVISYGQAGDGPMWFKAWTKAGQILSFGSTDGGRVDGQGKAVVRAWGLDRLEDTRGNYFTVSYMKDMDLGVHLPQRIDYTGNANTGLVPYNAVLLTYEGRPDRATVYQAGTYMRNGMRLSRIHVVANANALRTYRIAYQQEQATQRSRLVSVVECDDASNCLPQTTFQYGDNAPARFDATFTQVIGDWGYDAGRSWVDIDGDGRADYCRVIGADGNTRLSCLRSNGAGFGAILESPVLDPGWGAGRAWIDVNGDGRPDYCRLVGASGNQRLGCEMMSDSGFRRPLPSAILDPGYDAGRAWVDVNGDGRADYCRLVGGGARQLSCTLSTGEGFGATILSAPLDTGYDEGRAWVDVNGDGLADFCRATGAMGPGAGGIACTLSTGSGFSATISAAGLDIGDGDGRAWVDVNGDGKADFCRVVGEVRLSGSVTVVNLNNKRLACSLSTGSGFADAVYSDILDAGLGSGRDWVDVNGDGLADYCRIVGGGAASRIRCTFSSAVGFGDSIDSDIIDAGADAGRAWVDVNGDGIPDFCRTVGADNPASRAIACTPGRVGSRGMSAIDNGVGQLTTIEYAPLTDPAVYTKESGAVYPVSDQQFPLYVVRVAHQPNGIGGSVDTEYRHSGLKIDFSGRGLLGFRTTDIRETSAGLYTRLIYRQDFPYVGMTSVLMKTDKAGSWSQPLRTVSYTYGCTDPASAIPCKTMPGQRYFTYLARQVEQGADLDGSALPQVTTSSQFDLYGNATEIKVEASDGFIKLTTNTYANDERAWILGRLLRSRITNTVP